MERGSSAVKRFERSNGLDIALYRNYLLLDVTNKHNMYETSMCVLNARVL